MFRIQAQSCVGLGGHAKPLEQFIEDFRGLLFYPDVGVLGIGLEQPCFNQMLHLGSEGFHRLFEHRTEISKIAPMSLNKSQGAETKGISKGRGEGEQCFHKLLGSRC